MTVIKKLKIKQADGSFGNEIPIGVNAIHVLFSDGKNLEDKITEIEEKIQPKLTKLEWGPWDTTTKNTDWKNEWVNYNPTINKDNKTGYWIGSHDTDSLPMIFDIVTDADVELEVTHELIDNSSSKAAVHPKNNYRIDQEKKQLIIEGSYDSKVSKKSGKFTIYPKGSTKNDPLAITLTYSHTEEPESSVIVDVPNPENPSIEDQR